MEVAGLRMLLSSINAAEAAPILMGMEVQNVPFIPMSRDTRLLRGMTKRKAPLYNGCVPILGTSTFRCRPLWIVSS